MLVRTLRRFAPLGLEEDCVITVPADERDAFDQVLKDAFPGIRYTLVDGGVERQQSVENGLAALRPETEIALIHDAARPFISPESVQAAIEAARDLGAATVAIPSVDTILVADCEERLEDTPDRTRLWACQTPQVFQVDLIRRAHEAARAAGTAATDDATLVRQMGMPVQLVRGTALNFKVTTPEDLALAECVIERGLT